MHDSVDLQLGTSLQSARLQLANLLQNCYFCLIQKTISNSILWSLVIKYFWPDCFAPPYLLRPGATAPLCPPSVTPLATTTVVCSIFHYFLFMLNHRNSQELQKDKWKGGEQDEGIIKGGSHQLSI